MAKKKLPPFARRLRELREAKGFTVAELAEKVGVARQHLYLLEAGSNEPRFSLACRLADALGVKTDDLRGQ